MDLVIALTSLILWLSAEFLPLIANGIQTQRDWVPPCTCKPGILICHNIKDRLPSDLSDCKAPMTIEVKDSNIKTLKRDTFNQITKYNVTRLIMTNCNVSVIQPKALEIFPNLRDLNLTYNNLTWSKFSKGLHSSLRLEVIHLDGNQLGKVGKLVFQSSLYASLKKLSMKDCHITDIDNNAFDNFSNLSTVHLSTNNIKNLDFLRSLHMTGKELIHLDLSYNKIENISVFDGSPTNSSVSRIVELSLDGNPLQLQEKQPFSTLTNIKVLWLRDLTKVDKLPSLKLPNLEKLHLRGSSFRILTTTTEVFSGLPNLSELDMSYINFSAIPEQTLQAMFQPLSNMKHLYLTKTNFKGSIGDMFKSMSDLKTLHLDYNEITNISFAFSSIQQMEYLYLNNNNISVVVPDTDLPPEGSHHLHLYDNPFHCTCALAKFRMYLSRHWGEMGQYGSYTCQSPKEYAEKSLFDFNPLYSDCHGFNPYVVTAIVVCVVLILGVLAVSILNSNKHRIRRYWNARKLKGQYTEIGKGSVNTAQVEIF